MEHYISITTKAMERLDEFASRLEREEYKNQFVTLKGAVGTLYAQTGQLVDVLEETRELQQTEEKRLNNKIKEMQQRFNLSEKGLRDELHEANLSNLALVQKLHVSATSSASALRVEKDMVAELETMNIDLRKEMDAIREACDNQPVSLYDFNKGLEKLSTSLMKHMETRSDGVAAPTRVLSPQPLPTPVESNAVSTDFYPAGPA